MNKPNVYGPYFQLDSDWHGDGSHLGAGYYYRVTDSTGKDLDVAGPFDDEHDCELAMRRAE